MYCKANLLKKKKKKSLDYSSIKRIKFQKNQRNTKKFLNTLPILSS